MFVFIFINTLTVFSGPAITTYQAKIIKPDGYPLESSNVNFKFTILDPTGTCILYSEMHSAVNMNSTGGLISFALGTGIKTYPTSGTTFEQVFSNITPSLSCDAGGPVSINPGANDIRKIVMQFHDGNGWQTLPAMNINAVPYAMYSSNAEKLGGVSATSFVQRNEFTTCASGEALTFNGTSFSCITAGAGSGPVSAAAITAALGYTPADGASYATVVSNLNSLTTYSSNVSSTVFLVSSTVANLSSTVTSLSNSVAASFAALTSGITSLNGSTSETQSFSIGSFGAGPNVLTNNGVHTFNFPLASSGGTTAGLISNADYSFFSTVSGKITSSAASLVQVLGYVPAVSGSFTNQWINPPTVGGIYDMGPLLGPLDYSTGSLLQNSITDFSKPFTAGETIISVFDSPVSTPNSAIGTFRLTQTSSASLSDYSSLVGEYNVLSNDGGGSLNQILGDTTLVINYSDGSVAVAQATASRIYNYKGNITSSFGGIFGSSNQGGSIVNNYNLMIDSAVGTGVMNNYGLFISDQSSVVASQTYNIFSAGSAANNHFAGSMGVGVLLPRARVHIAAGTNSLAPFKLTSGALTTSPTSGAIEYDGFNLYYTDGTNTRRALATAGSGVTSSAIATALGYTPANSSTVNTLSNSLTTTNSNVSAVSAAVTSLAASTATSFSSFISSQWVTSGSTLNYVSGNVGIGTSSPSYLLDVSGTARANRFYANNGVFNNPSITFAGNPGTGFYNASGWLGISVNSSLVGTWTTGSLNFNAGGAGPQIYFSGGNAAQPSYAFNVDSDTGMFNPNAGGGSNELAFSTSGVERVRITSGGAVGLGIDTPKAKLDVRGDFVTGLSGTCWTFNNAVMSNNAMAAPTMLLGAEVGCSSVNVSIGGQPTFGPTSTKIPAQNIIFYTGSASVGNGTEKMRLDQTGYLGVGVTSVSAPIDVFASAGAAENIRLRGRGSGLEGGQLTLMDAIGSGGWEIDSYGTSGSERIRIFRDKASENIISEPFAIYPTGNVAVGSHTPNSTFSVYSTNNINTGSNLASGIGAIRISDGTSIGLLFDTNQIEQMDSTNNLYLNHNSSAPTIINYGGGNVGIGTTAPGGKLEVAGTGTMLINGTGSTFRVTAPNSSNSDYFQVGWISEDNWGIMTADSATHRNLVVTPWGGNFGVGVTSPQYKVDIAGDIRITGTPYRAGGDIAWTVPSDARLKDVVSKYNRGLREIANIETIIYKYKKDNPKQADTSKEYTGVLAQNVQEQIPEAVNTDKDGFLSLNTTPIFWAMINAIKELYHDFKGIKAENAQLKLQADIQARKIQSLQEENAAVKARLERIEKALQQQNK